MAGTSAKQSKSARKNARRKAKKNGQKAANAAACAAKVIEAEKAIVRSSRIREIRKGAKGAGGSNPYLSTLVDPEGHQGVRYPDPYSRKTAMIHGLINYNIPYNTQATASSAEQNGDFLCILSPSLMDPFLIYQYDANVGVLKLSVATQTDYSGLFPVSLDTPTISDVTDQMVLTTSYQNLVGNWYYEDQTFGVPGFEGTLNDGTTYSGFPMATTSAQAITCSFLATTSVFTGDIFTIQVVGINGLYGTAPGVVTTGTFTTTTSGPQLVKITTPAVSLQCGRPGIGFRLMYTPIGGTEATCFIQGVDVRVQTNGASTFRFDTVSLPDQTTYAARVDQYRVVSMSNWIEYEGSDLNNGGQIAGIMYGGGNAPTSNGLYTYNQIAQTPGAYQQALRYGMYSFWKPYNDNDMLFQTINTSKRWDHPYIVASGVVATTTQTNALRARINFNYEVISSSQLWTYGQANISEKEIEDAARRLKTVPTTMENPKHWETIQAVINGVGGAINTGINIAKFIAPYALPVLGKIMGGAFMM